ncbi:hypothetical protein EG350_07080 [Chryseobacterium shandongense]|nr:hypothetical protein EG350_07080 [Chryseobacterium shandongense]
MKSSVLTKIESISEYHEKRGLPPPHPLISVIDGYTGIPIENFGPRDEIIRAAPQIVLVLRAEMFLHGGVTAAELPGVCGHLFTRGIDRHH